MPRPRNTQHHTNHCLEESRARVCWWRLDSAPSVTIQGSSSPATSNGLVNSLNRLRMVLLCKRPGRPASMHLAGMQRLPAPSSASQSKPGHSLAGVGPTATNHTQKASTRTSTNQAGRVSTKARKPLRRHPLYAQSWLLRTRNFYRADVLDVIQIALCCYGPLGTC